MSRQETDIELALEYAHQGSNPTTIAKLDSGWLFMGLNQVLKGTCFLVAEPVVPTLDDLNQDQRTKFIDDMLKAGHAIMAVTGADRVNYLFLGNKDPVLHVHLVPRFSDEDPEYKTHGPWKYKEYVKFEPSRDQALIDKLKQAL